MKGIIYRAISPSGKSYIGKTIGNMSNRIGEHFRHAKRYDYAFSRAKRKISEANRGNKHTKVTKKKISESHRGENHPLYGKHHSTETKEKLSKAGSGENNSRARLTYEKVQEIKEKYATKKYSYAKLAGRI